MDPCKFWIVLFSYLLHVSYGDPSSTAVIQDGGQLVLDIGQSVILRCETDQPGPVSWYHKSKLLTIPSKEKYFQLNSEVTRIEIIRLDSGDTGEYQCALDNPNSPDIRKNKPHTLLINYAPSQPFIKVEQNGNMIGDEIELNCVLKDKGYPEADSFTWFDEAGNTKNKSSLSIYKFKSDQKYSSYKCNASNKKFKSEDSEFVHISLSAPVRIEKRRSLTDRTPVYKHAAIYLRCIISGSEIPPVTWYKHETPITDLTESNILYSINKPTKIQGHFMFGQSEATLSRLEINIRDKQMVTCEQLESLSGEYSCTVKNEKHSVDINVQYTAMLANKTTHETGSFGDTLTLTCPVCGNPAPSNYSVTWTNLHAHGIEYRNDMITITNFSKDFTGQYTCALQGQNGKHTFNIQESNESSLGSTSNDKSNKGSNAGTIAGICVAGIIVLIGIAVVAVMLQKKYNPGGANYLSDICTKRTKDERVDDIEQNIPLDPLKERLEKEREDTERLEKEKEENEKLEREREERERQEREREERERPEREKEENERQEREREERERLETERQEKERLERERLRMEDERQKLNKKRQSKYRPTAEKDLKELVPVISEYVEEMEEVKNKLVSDLDAMQEEKLSIAVIGGEKVGKTTLIKSLGAKEVEYTHQEESRSILKYQHPINKNFTFVEYSSPMKGKIKTKKYLGDIESQHDAFLILTSTQDYEEKEQKLIQELIKKDKCVQLIRSKYDMDKSDLAPLKDFKKQRRKSQNLNMVYVKCTDISDPGMASVVSNLCTKLSEVKQALLLLSVPLPRQTLLPLRYPLMTNRVWKVALRATIQHEVAKDVLLKEITTNFKHCFLVSKHIKQRAAELGVRESDLMQHISLPLPNKPDSTQQTLPDLVQMYLEQPPGNNEVVNIITATLPLLPDPGTFVINYMTLKMILQEIYECAEHIHVKIQECEIYTEPDVPTTLAPPIPSEPQASGLQQSQEYEEISEIISTTPSASYDEKSDTFQPPTSFPLYSKPHSRVNALPLVPINPSRSLPLPPSMVSDPSETPDQSETLLCPISGEYDSLPPATSTPSGSL